MQHADRPGISTENGNARGSPSFPPSINHIAVNERELGFTEGGLAEGIWSCRTAVSLLCFRHPSGTLTALALRFARCDQPPRGLSPSVNAHAGRPPKKRPRHNGGAILRFCCAGQLLTDEEGHLVVFRIDDDDLVLCHHVAVGAQARNAFDDLIGELDHLDRAGNLSAEGEPYADIG
jgi:hypothetical protein